VPPFAIARPATQVVAGGWLLLAGAFAVMAGLADMRRTRRLRCSGVKNWAMVVRAADSTADPDGLTPATMIQFSLADGRVVEQACPNSGRAGRLKPGQKVLVWYDPADPADVLVYCRHARRADGLFVAAGSALILAGVGISAFAR
jgi:Protein of unknown function (DUF3592)